MSRLLMLAAYGSLFLSLGMTGCVSNAYKDIEVQAEADPEARFSEIKTYQWAAAAALVRDPMGEWQPPDLDIGGEIVFLVNRELRGRGMREVTRSPDALVVYGVGVDMRAMQIVSDPNPDVNEIESLPKAGVLVVLADPQTYEALWAGGAVADVMEEPDADLAKRRLDFAIRKMFEKMPR